LLPFSHFSNHRDKPESFHEAQPLECEPSRCCLPGLAKRRLGRSNPAGSAIVNTTGPIRQILQGEQQISRRYPVIAEGLPNKPGAVVQVQVK
jgi:hypothetical protein